MASSPERPPNLKGLTDAAGASLWAAMNHHDDTWGVRSSDWDVNQSEETILFTNREDGSQRTAPVQIIATH
ncbi:MAG: hypothetical protein GEU79_16090, partial [Acidimicrobiia bacterium]|nr:hypothetical protein [Acidimicrobiia bacterium]